MPFFKKTKILVLFFFIFFLTAPLLFGEVPPEETHFQNGLKYYLKGEDSAAITELKNSLVLNPDYEPAKRLLSIISEHKVMAEDALNRTIGTLDLKNADINDVLRLFSQEYGLNIVAGKEVVGTVTISFSNITVGEALKAILELNGFAYEKVGNFYWVTTWENLYSRPYLTAAGVLSTEIITLNYANAEEIKRIITPQLSPAGSVEVLVNLLVGGWEMSGVSTSEKEIGKKVRTKSSKEELPRTLILTDFPAVINRVLKIVKELDVKPPQILIEAMIVEVNTQAVKDIGIEWHVDDYDVNKIKYGFVPGTVTTPSPGFTGFGFEYNLDTSGNPLAPFAAKIHALEQDKKANILSSPRIMTQEGQEATILVGERYPIIKTDVTATATAPITTETLDHYEPIGVSLRVIPKVIGKDEINMVIHPEVSSLGEDVVGSTGVRFKRINTREVDTNVTVKNGQVVVIGGLISNEDRDTIYKIPLLGDIPVLGHLFKRTVKEPKKVELLVFIAPRITPESADASKLYQEKASGLLEKK